MALAKLLPLLLPLCVTVGMAQTVTEPAQDTDMTTRSIEQVLRDQRDRIMSVHGVVGTGIGLCGERPCIKVYTSEPASALAEKLPGNIDGYTIDIEMTGPIRALPEEP